MKPQLTPPVGPRDHRLGAEAASLTLVEYGDYQCPYCVSAYSAVKAIRNRLGPRVRFVFRNYPLEQLHPQARLAAEAAEAAGAQDRFWPMHDALFEDRRALGVEALTARAEAIGLDVRRFREDLEHRRLSARVDEDLRSGDASGIRGTPTFFINGRRVEGPSDEDSLLAALHAASPED